MKKSRKPKQPNIREAPEFEQKLVDLARVTRVTRGGKQLSFRALIVLGDKKSKVSYGLAKGKDVTIAVSKAVDQAKKRMIVLSLNKGTISHEIRHKFGAARVMLKPAPTGTGVKAGGAVRTMLDLGGIENIVGKIMGSNNKINNIKCTFEALKLLKKPRNVKKEKKIEKNTAKKSDTEKGEK